ncbi:penicillin-binding protein, partial [Georgenia sp. 10Sc9-8]|nr:penicillin-binding protein [Georgenia halotolerans]
MAAAGPSAFVEAIVVRTGSDVVDLAEVEILPGARALPDELPLAPTAAFARPVLGTAGEATQEIVAESDGAVAPGDLVGLSGLQRQYDELLRGTPGIRIVRRQDGAPGEVLVETTARQGADLTVTLDVGLQQAAEEVLAQTETPSGLVALQPSTGAVLAAASGTGSGGFSTATLGQYAPGSTFKVVS